MAFYKMGEHFQWFIARVVNLEDEYRLGRVQIRVIDSQTGEILGKFKENRGITDEQLLWAWPISAIQSASLHQVKINEKEKVDMGIDVPSWIGAVGLSPTGIAIGTYVYGFYLDGIEKNIPMIFGTYHKQSKFPEEIIDGESYLQTQELQNAKGYWDVAPLAQGDFTDPQGATVKGQSLPKEETQAVVLKMTNEPKSAYDVRYPFNTTYTTKSGHAIELDDTPGHERLHMWHKSGSYEEISNGTGFEGRRVVKTVGNDYHVVKKDKHILVKQSEFTEVNNARIVSVGGAEIKTVGENQTIDVKSHRHIHVQGETTYIHMKNRVITIEGNDTLTVNGAGGLTINANDIILNCNSVTVSGGLEAESLSARTAAGAGQPTFFTTSDGKTVTVVNGIVTNIV